MSSECRVCLTWLCITYCMLYMLVDTTSERRALMESVYPRLYLHCKQRGYDFRMIDLRAGVGDPVSEHHDLAELHVQMLKRCQETEGTNFFVCLIAHSSFLDLGL